MNIASINNLQFLTSNRVQDFSKTLINDRSLKNFCFYVENDFVEMLSRERKRSKRTSMPFLLMLIDINKALQKKSARNMTRILASLLTANTRETDIKGWYRDNATIGVIFVGIEEADIYSAKEIIAGKMKQKLKENIDQELLDVMKLSFHIFPEKYDVNLPDNSLEPVLYPDLTKTTVSKVTGSILKRCLDVTGSIFGLLLFSPLFLIISILVKATSKGPVFFKQQRVGPFGKTFTFLKFRSMHVNNDETIHREYVTKLIEGNKDCEQNREGDTKCPVFKIKSDPRITPLGQFLRKTSLDELPQFLNVLKGEMSIVGPRPPIPYEFEKYDIWHRERLLSMKPGITGLWQVMGRSSTSFDEMVRLDVKYLREWSLWRDIVIIIKTPMVMVRGKGAY
jgi:exopolysaccharide biosynthesis polyprenyl glycosylphosphotransferase